MNKRQRQQVLRRVLKERSVASQREFVEELAAAQGFGDLPSDDELAGLAVAAGKIDGDFAGGGVTGANGGEFGHHIVGIFDAAFGFGVVLNATVDECEEGVILADADVMAGMPFGPALACENVAGSDALAAEQLDAKPPARRVAAVPR